MIPIGHDAVWDRLRAVVRRGRVAHAYLFSGPEGVGKRLVALRFARALLCAQQGDDECTDCRHVREETHPHLILVSRAEGKQDISISQVRELHRQLSLKPSERKPRVVILDGAERLSLPGMNALLKVLEEPPPLCVFVLVTSAPASLLPTILSRCHTVRFGLVPEDLVRLHLEETGIAPEVAALTARITGGRIGLAMGGHEELSEARAWMEEALGHIFRHDLNPIVEQITRIRDPKKSRRRAAFLLDLLLLPLREILRARLRGRPPDPEFVPKSARDVLAPLSADEIAERVETLLDHRRFLDLNANVGLTVENALLHI